jgi:superfamily II DNA or RNA helicase/HKD family nuclease
LDLVRDGSLSDMPVGIYESLLTEGLFSRLANTAGVSFQTTEVDGGEEPHQLATHLSGIIRHALESKSGVAERIDLARRLIAVLGEDYQQAVPRNEGKLASLTEIRALDEPSTAPFHRPESPLSAAALLTNSSHEPSLGAELRAELDTADRVDLLCAFVKWHGLRILEEQLAELKRRQVPFRVITTTYVGATERRALDRIVRDFGGEVRISYETTSTRLHAKAWMFHRKSGFSTAYVGSSNLSKSALLDGLEWNVRLSSVATPELMKKFEATFESYWQDPAFEAYDPDLDADRLDQEISNGSFSSEGKPVDLSGLDVRPYPHQSLILEDLQAERAVHHRHRNLVVAATGTGKTVVAGLDYRNLVTEHKKDLRILFVAHRKEILDQARRTYRNILGDGSFGELFVDGQRPVRWNHVFASVQSLTSKGFDSISREHFDVVVIDEFHHAEAATYRRILDHVQPVELLGLTATPERADGVNVKSFFDNRIASELRLWDALDSDILVPFHYFGVADEVDVSGVSWRAGKYDVSELDKLYTGNEARARLVARQLVDKSSSVDDIKALGFCVSVHHAQFMAARFNAANIPSAVVTGGTPRDERRESLEALRSGKIKCIFTVDVFNEGLDIPQVNTVLFLRPTQSATIFLQQLGRGLRRSFGKDVLTVLDFIGMQRKEFRFDQKLRALTGSGRKRLIDDIEGDFPFLPAGSQIVLDAVAKDVVINNVKGQIAMTANQLARDIREHAGDRSLWEYRLDQYLDEAGRSLSDVYRSGKNGRSWTTLKMRADRAEPRADLPQGELHQVLRSSSLVHVDDQERAETYLRLLRENVEMAALTKRERQFAEMLYFTALYQKGQFASLDDAYRWARKQSRFVGEVEEIFEHTLSSTRANPSETALGSAAPLLAHAHYRREEILPALGIRTFDRSPDMVHVSGVAWSEGFASDAFLINLKKSERDFSPSTMYRDYAISRDQFHWESQNNTRATSVAGRRYTTKETKGTNTLLFVREAPENEMGAAPFVCLGTAELESWKGERPMQVTWRLHREMPVDVYRTAGAVA